MNWRRLWLLPLAVAFVWVAAYAAALPKAHILSIAMQQGALVGDESAALLSAITMPKAHMLSVQVQPSIAKALPQAFSVAFALPAGHILHVQVNRPHTKRVAHIKPKVKIIRVVHESGIDPFSTNDPTTTCSYTGIWTGTATGGGIVSGSTCTPGPDPTVRQIGITVASDCSWKDGQPSSQGGGTIDPATGTFIGTLPAGVNAGPCNPTKVTGTLGQNSGSGRFTDLGGTGTWTLNRGGTLPTSTQIPNLVVPCPNPNPPRASTTLAVISPTSFQGVFVDPLNASCGMLQSSTSPDKVFTLTVTKSGPLGSQAILTGQVTFNTNRWQVVSGNTSGLFSDTVHKIIVRYIPTNTQYTVDVLFFGILNTAGTTLTGVSGQAAIN